MEPVLTHRFVCDPQNPSGEQLIIITKFIPNGDPEGIFTNHKITLQSYCNSASINLCGTQLSPEILRKLAHELEIAHQRAIISLNNNRRK